ncbi:tag1 protein [Lactobacillus selangorensis]|uniref:Tag1 protein n=1 Tax=Lactobacillus selangorensis TaxID=81857 RepID=A0A0R2FUE9_9LACO|nr:DNA-3-methyladenine glycosylase I [Lactobacillus selangorensis]KRN29050.1 tag1 protein [Lactobacillus selangorensis]KRN30037.1 tag1 protein [Lactobacillus selangorensis]
MTEKLPRWAQSDALMADYYVHEWGHPEHDSQKLFELLSLETYQAGLSWLQVLQRRAAFQKAFHQYDIEQVAQMTDQEIDQLMQNPGLIRNRLKLTATVQNAQAIQKLPESFAAYLWSFVDGRPQVHHPATWADVPSQDALSQRVAKQLKKDGFHFVGPVIVYAFLQASGVIDDHVRTK